MPKHRGSCETTPEVRELICKRASTGQPLSQVAIEFSTPLRTVQAIIKRWTERGNHKNAPRSGRPPLLDSWALRQLNFNILQDRQQTLQDIAYNFNLSLPSPVHPTTVRRAMDSCLGMSRRVAAKKPFLKPIHIKK
jgi:transposase